MPLAEKYANGTATEEDAWKNEDIRYSSRVTDESTLDFLNGQKTMKVYRAMQVIDGKLYPPMAAKVKDENGKWSLQEPTEIGAWYQSEERPDLADENGFFVLNKGNGTSLKARYNPYWHTSATPLNDQFSSAYNRPNLVTVEGEIPVSELTSGYRAEKAKDSVGETKWHAGPVASKLKGDKARRVYLSRWFKATRIVPDSEVAQIIAETLKGEDISVPSNVVTPSLLSELRKQGVPIEEIEGKGGIAAVRRSSRDIDTIKSTAYNKGIYYGDDIYMSRQEYAILRQEIVRKNTYGRKKGEKPKRVDYAFTSNYFYLYRTSGLDSFSPLVQIDIEKNKGLATSIIRSIDNGTFKRTASADEWTRFVRITEGSHDGRDAHASGTGANNENDELDGRPNREGFNAERRGDFRTSLRDTQNGLSLNKTQAPDGGAFSSPENDDIRYSARADSDISWRNAPALAAAAEDIMERGG